MSGTSAQGIAATSILRIGDQGPFDNVSDILARQVFLWARDKDDSLDSRAGNARPDPLENYPRPRSC